MDRPEDLAQFEKQLIEQFKENVTEQMGVLQGFIVSHFKTQEVKIAALQKENKQLAKQLKKVKKNVSSKISGFMIDKNGQLVVVSKNGKIKELGQVVGKDGKDGLSLESFDLELADAENGQKKIKVIAKANGRTKSLLVPVPVMQHKGYWKHGTTAQPLDLYAHQGALWIANKTTGNAPSGTLKEDWTLAARAGRDATTQITTS